MTNLSDIQRILLSAATQRADGSLLPAPDTLTNVGARITKALAALVKHELAEERETNDAARVVRDEGHRLVGVFITPAGAAAIGVGENEPAGAASAGVDPVLGDEAISGAQAPRSTKTSMVLALLGRGEGATLPELTSATGWLPHTTRAALTGLRKKGHAIARCKRDGLTCYRIESAA